MDTRIFTLHVLTLCCLVHGSLQGAYQRRLYKELMRNYNPLERPVNNDSHSLTVHFSFSLLQIMDVDEKNQVLTTNIWLQLTLHPSHFLFDSVTWDLLAGGVEHNNIGADERFDASFHTNILVNSSGHCQYLPPGIFKSTCYINVRWFPFDVQRCDLKFGSWTYGGWSLDLQMIDADVTGYIANGEWDLLEVPGQRNERFYDCCKEPFYLFTTTCTCVRCITVLLSLTVFMLLVAEIMPATSDSVPLIAQYFATTMVIVGLSVIATVLVLQYHHHDPDGGHMPRWTRVVLLNWFAWFLRMRRSGEAKVRLACHNAAKRRRGSRSSSQGSPRHHPQVANGDMLYVGFRGLEGFHYTSSTEPELLRSRLVGGGVGGEKGLLRGGGGAGVRGAGAAGRSALEVELNQILEEVRYIGRRFREQDEEETVCSEWKFAAAVIDRLCLVAFSLFTILCTIGILMSAPNFVEAISKDFFS
ncbi:hypothetical protein Q5P01_000198 [Channa striata]|uniref:Neuronal acetylcholine receptor subunit alpha-7-like n=1 Tax=Channa striata TaxID=64152 RepID=A0AA88IJ37_CHASR|nr:hypothetical protein Q5P01_000198 [Channa striata]